MQFPIDVTIRPTQISAVINNSAVYDLCINSSLPTDNPSTLNIGHLKKQQCSRIITLTEDLSILEVQGMTQTPNFFWCCGKNIWAMLPHKWTGLCGVCIMNDMTYIVQPVASLNMSKSHVHKRGLGQYLGSYIHLLDSDPNSLRSKFNALPDEFRPFTSTQQFFKSWFLSTNLQYENHYLIAITTHDLVKLSNETIRGFQANHSELAAIKRFTNDNRIALDFLVAEANGVCSLVGTDSCCTYLPSNDEGNDNLTMAINNLRRLNQEIVQTNLDAKRASGFTIPGLDGILDFFQNNSIVGWFIGILTPLFIILVIAGLLICCCLPIIRAFIIKSVSSSYTLINNPRNMTIYATSPVAPGVSDDQHSSSDASSLAPDPYPHRYPFQTTALDALDFLNF